MCIQHSTYIIQILQQMCIQHSTYIIQKTWCIVVKTVRPSKASFRITDIVFCALNESKPVVGSSKNIRRGSLISSEAIFKRFRSPPLILPTFVFIHSFSPKSFIMLCARESFSSFFKLFGRRNKAASVIVSNTVRLEKKQSYCCTYAHINRKYLKSRLTPFTST